MPRLRQSNGPYEKISQQDKQRLLDAYENDEDFVELAKSLKIKRTTAYNIVKRGRATNLPRGGSGLNRKVDDECVDTAIRCLEENPLLSLKELNVIVHQLLNKPSFSDQALSNALDGSLITLKLTRDRPAERITVDTREQRYDYASWLMGPNVVNENKFFIDEFGINIHTRRNQGRSKKGDRVYRRVSGQRGPNITVCIAVSNRQWLVH